MASPPSDRSGSPGDDLRGHLLAGRYRLNEPIASGGMAQVWEATDEILARRVAVKILHPHLARDEAFVRRFRAEAVAAARLTHPSIVSVYDTVVEDGTNAIVMELVSGTTMRADLDRHGPLRLNALLAIGTQVADALGAAHASGIVHRDVKPANILLSADGRVLVADFGIAKALENADLTSEGAMVGTAKYLAPEQVEDGPIDGRTDLYALGVVLYEAATGQPPFTADTEAGTALARLHRDPVPPQQVRPEIPASVAAVITQAMARRPEARFQDAASMRRALLAAGADPSQAPAAAQAAASHAPPGAPHPQGASSQPSAPPFAPAPSNPPGPHAVPVAPIAHPVEPERRRGWGGIAIAVVVVLLVAAVGLGLASSRDSTGASGRPVAIAGVADFDPQGDEPRREHPELLPAVTDGNPDTAWRTENYKAADLGAKDGVGLILTTPEPVDLTRLDITTPAGGWTADVYLSAGAPPSDLAAWGEPVATAADVPSGTVGVDLPGSRAGAVLIWFTRLAPTQGGNHAASVTAVDLRAR